MVMEKEARCEDVECAWEVEECFPPFCFGKVFVSFGSEKFSYLWVLMQKVFVSFVLKGFRIFGGSHPKGFRIFWMRAKQKTKDVSPCFRPPPPPAAPPHYSSTSSFSSSS